MSVHKYPFLMMWLLYLRTGFFGASNFIILIMPRISKRGLLLLSSSFRHLSVQSWNLMYGIWMENKTCSSRVIPLLRHCKPIGHNDSCWARYLKSVWDRSLNLGELIRDEKKTIRLILSELCPIPTLAFCMDKRIAKGIVFYKHISSYSYTFV